MTTVGAFGFSKNISQAGFDLRWIAVSMGKESGQSQFGYGKQSAECLQLAAASEASCGLINIVSSSEHDVSQARFWLLYCNDLKISSETPNS